jgi:two-component system, OmpR family, response regulator
VSNSVDPSRPTDSGHEPPPLRVLLIEDHADLAVVTAALLESEGLDVRAALTGREALALAAAFQPQLVLCDMHLPDMPGYDVVRGLRANPATEWIYVAALSAMGRMEPTGRNEGGTELVFDAMLHKPITVETIRQLVEDARARMQPDRDSPGR